VKRSRAYSGGLGPPELLKKGLTLGVLLQGVKYWGVGRRRRRSILTGGVVARKLGQRGCGSCCLWREIGRASATLLVSMELCIGKDVGISRRKKKKLREYGICGGKHGRIQLGENIIEERGTASKKNGARLRWGEVIGRTSKSRSVLFQLIEKSILEKAQKEGGIVRKRKRKAWGGEGGPSFFREEIERERLPKEGEHRWRELRSSKSLIKNDCPLRNSIKKGGALGKSRRRRHRC